MRVLAHSAALFLFATLLTAQRVPLAAPGSIPVTAMDSDLNLIVAYNLGVADLPTTATAVQPRFAGGTCFFFGFHMSTEAPCSDLYVAKYSPTGALLAATYLGGTGAELLTSIAVNPAGDVILLGTTQSKDFRDLSNPNSQLNGFIVRLSPSFDRLIASRAFDPAFSPNLLYLAGDSLLASGKLNAAAPVVLSLNASNFSQRWQYLPPGDPQTNVRAFTRLTSGDIALVVSDPLGTGVDSGVYRLNPATGAVVASQQVTGPNGHDANQIQATTLAALPGDGLVLGGAYYPKTVDPYYNNRLGFFQRFDAKLQPVETAQPIGDFVNTLEADAAGLIRIWGTATSGLATTADAPVRCHGDGFSIITSTYYAELPYAQGSPRFVTYVPDPDSLKPGIASFVNGDPVLSTINELIVSKRPTPAGPQPACLDIKVQSYTVTLNRAPIINVPFGYLKTDTAPGELLTVFGSGLSDATFEFVPELLGGVPREAGNTRFLVDGVPAGIVSLSPNRATLAMPFGIAGRETVQVALERDGQTGAAIPLKVLSTAPSQLTVKAMYGDRYGVYLNGAPCTVDNPAHPGDEVAVYLVGGGVFDRPVDESKIVTAAENDLPRTANSVTAFVEGFGGQVVRYAGAVRGELPGLMQVNVRIASDLKYRDRLTLAITIDGRSSSSTFWLKQPD